MAKHHRRLTEADRDERRARDRERLKDACEQLLSSEGWQRWVRARARNGLARYSVSNLCLILLANPNASFVAGFKAWLEPATASARASTPSGSSRRCPRAAATDDPTAETDEEQRRVLFRAVPVFDRCQVDALDGRQPAPLEPPSQPLTGESHAHLIEPAAAFARSCGYAVAFETTPPGTGGGAIGPTSGSSSTPTRRPTRNCGSRPRSAAADRSIRRDAAVLAGEPARRPSRSRQT